MPRQRSCSVCQQPQQSAVFCGGAVPAELPTLQYKEGRLAKDFIYNWKNDKHSLLVRTATTGSWLGILGSSSLQQTHAGCPCR
jgi:hypothetical protein